MIKPYDLALAFLKDHFVYKDSGSKGEYHFGSEKDIGGFLYQLMYEHAIEIFGREALITILREIHDYSYSDRVIYALDRQDRIDWLTEECARKLAKKLEGNIS